MKNKDTFQVVSHVKARTEFDFEPSFAVGRNGLRPIKAVEVWEGNGCAYIDFITRARGKVLNAGGMLPVEAMDRLALAWLKERGKQVLVVTPSEDADLSEIKDRMASFGDLLQEDRDADDAEVL
tara:strand:+ start:793 stop:1164 length:372 start_codon:yes stop_codon:yes gene_type:complete